MSLGTRLKELRRAKKLTQKEVANRLEIDNTTISKWEADVYEPNTVTLVKLATLYETSVDQLLGRVPSIDYQRMLNNPALKDQSAGYEAPVTGRVLYGGSEHYTEEELAIADAAARAAVEAYRKGKARAQKNDQ
ncbi:helix-turn-helix domain-containing protein [Paenibacillus montanisoli]|nr:helix-turn-helix transcriptional regulator [Paenibacillus montanisoli]